MNQKKLQIEQLDKRIARFQNLSKLIIPQLGWIKSIRMAIGMTMNQLGIKLHITRQAVMDLEKREAEGSITLNALQETARAMDMKVVYVLLPIDGSIEALIDRKAKELATTIVMRTSNSMKLEDQENSQERLANSIKERTQQLKTDIPKILWD